MQCRICSKKMIFLEKLENCERDVTTVYNEPNISNLVDINIFKCESCTHYQIENILTNDYYENYRLVYTEEDNGVCGNHTDSMLEFYDKKFSLLSKYAESNETVLDIGCGSGILLNRLLKYFNFGIGIEPSKKQAENAKKMNGDKVNIINSYFDENISNNHKVSAFICTNVLEHLEEPISFLKCAYDILEFAGVGYIEVPSGQKIFDESQYFDIFSEHINYYTSQSLINLAVKANFHVLEIKEDFNNQYLTMFVKKIENRSSFREKINSDKELIKNICNNFNKISVWGAGCKARSLINIISKGIKINFIFDSNLSIQNKYLSNTDIKITVPTSEKINDNDLIIIFAINFKDEIIKDLREKFNYKGSIYSIDGMFEKEI